MKSNFKNNQLSADQGLLDRVVLHHSLGVEQLATKSYTEALISLKTAFQLAHSAGLTERLQEIAYDFGIAAMHIIHAVPSPAPAPIVTSPMVTQLSKFGKPKACASSPSLSTIPQSPTSQSPGVQESDDEDKGKKSKKEKKEKEKAAGKEEKGNNNNNNNNKAEAANPAATTEAQEDSAEMKLEKKRLAFRFRSASYSKFNESKNRSKPELGSFSQDSPPPTKRPFFRAASFGSNLRIKSNFTPPPPISATSDGSSALPSPPLTPPLGTGQVNESGVTTNDINSAASALCYLLRQVAATEDPAILEVKTPQLQEHPEEEERIWSGEQITSGEDLVITTPVLASKVMLKKAELCFMISQLYVWVGQLFLGEQYLKQAKENAAFYRLALDLPIDAPVFPAFEREDRQDLVVSKSAESLMEKISRKLSRSVAIS